MLITDTPSESVTTTAKELSFRKLVAGLAERVGHQHIPFQPHARDIHELLGPDAVHHDLVRSITRTIYRANCCGYLDAPVSMVETFTALGSIRAELAHCDETDIDQIDLIDSIGWHTRRLFSMDLDSPPKTKPESHDQGDLISTARSN